MLLGPIFRVEMVTASRRRRHFVLRTAYAALVLFVLWVTYSSSLFARGGAETSIQQMAMLAATFFQGFSWLQVLAILVVGPALAVGTIATERERRTIEFLFASHLSNAEIVLGKTIARLTILGQLLLVGLPILYLFRMLGGIPNEALLASFLCAMGAALLLTSLSICVSVWSPRVKDAAVRVYLLIIAMLLLPLILESLQYAKFVSRPIATAVIAPVVRSLLNLNPLWVLTRALGSPSAIGLGVNVPQVVRSVGIQIVVSCVCLAWAAFAVRRVHLNAASRPARRLKLRRLNIPRFRLPLGSRPMIWKEMFSSTSATRLGWVGWIALSILLAATVVWTAFFFWESHRKSPGAVFPTYFQYLMALSGFGGCFMLLLLAARAAGLFTQEKERDCWTSLLSTPLSAREIIWGKFAGNLYSARWMLAVLLFAWVLGVVLAPSFIWITLWNLANCLVLASFVTMLGLCYSLHSPTSFRSIGLTVGTSVFLGGGYLFCCCVVLQSNAGSGAFVTFFSPCIPFLLIFPTGVFLSINDRGNFMSEDALPLAYVMGMVGYALGSIVLYWQMVAEFDRATGRAHRRHFHTTREVPRA